jgi:hypothetical protein
MHRALSLAIALLAAVPATAAGRELDQPPRPTTIAARGDVLAYSRWDDTIGAFRLRVAVGDRAPVDVPVPPRSVPFDVHVGRATEPDGRRRTVLVYSRCRREPPLYPSIAPEQLWSFARGCSLRVASLDGGERAIRGTGQGVIPGVSGTTLTFVRFTHGKRPRVVVRRFDRPGSPLRVIGSGRGTPVDMDLLGDRLALTRRYQGHGEVEDSALDLVDIRSGRRRLIDHLNDRALHRRREPAAPRCARVGADLRRGPRGLRRRNRAGVALDAARGPAQPRTAGGRGVRGDPVCQMGAAGLRATDLPRLGALCADAPRTLIGVWTLL